MKEVKYVYNNGTLNEAVHYPSESWTRIVNSSGTFDFFYIFQNGELVAMKDLKKRKNIRTLQSQDDRKL